MCCILNDFLSTPAQLDSLSTHFVILNYVSVLTYLCCDNQMWWTHRSLLNFQAVAKYCTIFALHICVTVIACYLEDSTEEKLFVEQNIWSGNLGMPKFK